MDVIGLMCPEYKVACRNWCCQLLPLRCFHLPFYFRACAIRRCHLHLSASDPCCHNNQPLFPKTKLAAAP